MNFVEIKEEGVQWLFDLGTTTLLWQTWVSFWWWVGAGAWEGEGRELVEERERVKEKKRESKLKRKKELAALARERGELEPVDGNLMSGMRRRLTRSASAVSSMEPQRQNSTGGTESPRPSAPVRPAAPQSHSSLTSPSTTTPTTPPGGYFSHLYSFFAPILNHIGRQHNQAAVEAAVLQAAMVSEASLERRGRWAIGAGRGPSRPLRRTVTVEGDDDEEEEGIEEEEIRPAQDGARGGVGRGAGIEGTTKWWQRWRLKEVDTF